MINFRKESTNDLIIDLLSSGPVRATVIVENLKAAKAGISKQAVYLAIRKLIKDEAVVKYSKGIMLNQIWINQLNEFVDKVDKNYLEKNKRSKMKNELSEMTEGDKIIYLFKNINSFDSFWNHIFSIVVKKTNILAPLYLYNPHEWFLYAREKSDKYMWKWIDAKKPKTFFAIGGNTHLDKLVRKNYSTESTEISTGEKMGFEDNYCLAIIENYLIETYFDKELSNQVDETYNESKSEEEASEKIKEIISTKSRYKIVVSINSDKAAILKKKFEKIFLIPKSLKSL